MNNTLPKFSAWSLEHESYLAELKRYEEQRAAAPRRPSLGVAEPRVPTTEVAEIIAEVMADQKARMERIHARVLDVAQRAAKLREDKRGLEWRTSQLSNALELAEVRVHQMNRFLAAPWWTRLLWAMQGRVPESDRG